MKSEEKSFDTGLRILKMLEILLNEKLNKISLIEKINECKDIEKVYTLEAYIKYFNTLNHLGLIVNKDKNTYTLENALFRMELSSDEKRLLTEVLKNYDLLHNDEMAKDIEKFAFKLSKYLDESINENMLEKLFLSAKESASKTVLNNVVNSLKKLIGSQQQLQIEYKKRNLTVETIVVELREIIEKNGNIFIVCYNPKIGRNKKINMDSIISLKQLPTKTSNMNIKNSVIFELYGRLASLYKLKPSEKVLDFSKGRIVVSNAEEDKDVLLRRLLKYGENCKIIAPDFVKQEFLQLVDEVISNIEANYG